MPVGRRPCGLRGADVAAAAADVLHVELLPELLGELLRRDPSEYVGRTARSERHDDAHRPHRIVERRRALPQDGSGRSGPG